MTFDKTIFGHSLPQKILYNAMTAGKLGHAYLFCGTEGIGKRMTAFAIAKSLLCQESIPFCGKCASCLKADHRTHPDLFEIVPDGTFIKIAQIKQLQEQMALRPAISSKKVFIIDGIDQMNSEAANSFLKSLEEPPADTYFFLISSRPQAVPSTLLSRCQQIRFNPSSPEALVPFLIDRKNVSPQDALRIAKRAEGRAGAALHLDLESLDQEEEQYLKLLQPENIASPSKLFQNAEECSRDPALLKKSLEWMSALIRDMIVWKTSPQPGEFIFSHHPDKINEWSSRFSLETLYRAFSFLQRIERFLTRNLNRPLILETALLQFYAGEEPPVHLKEII
jgi:DNA polymerase-3 subunit delta'